MKTIIEDEVINLFDDNDKLCGSIDFYINDDVICVMHTNVNKEYQNQGLGNVLFDALIKYSKEKGYLIKPFCPYIRTKLEKSKEYAKLIYK